MTSVIGIAGGLGTVVAGAVFDMFGNYDALLLFRLGAFPRWETEA